VYRGEGREGSENEENGQKKNPAGLSFLRGKKGWEGAINRHHSDKGKGK